MKDILQNMLIRLVLHSYQNPWRVMVMIGLLSVFFGFSALKLQFVSDISNLLDHRLPEVQATQRYFRENNGAGFEMITIHSPSPTANDRFLQHLHQKLIGHPQIRVAIRKNPTAFFQKHGLLWMETSKLRELERLIQNKIKYESRKNSPLYIALIKDRDPDIDLQRFVQREEEASQSMPTFLSSQGQHQGLFLQPTDASGNITFTRSFVHNLQSIVSSLQPCSYHPQMKIQYFGHYTAMLNEVDGVQREMLQATLLAAFFLVVLLFVYFRGWRPLGWVLLTLSIGTLWAMGLAALLVGSLNMLTGFVTAILFGLGIDYGIYWLSRYQQERSLGHTPLEACERCTRHTGLAICLGGLTTMMAFFTLCFSNFKGFSELGLIAGLGVLTCLFTTFTLLPVCLAFFEKQGLTAFRSLELSITTQAPIIQHHRKIGWLFVGIAVIALFVVPWARFEYRQSKLMYLPQGQVTRDAQVAEFHKLFPFSMMPMVFLTHSAQQAQHLTQKLRQLAQNQQYPKAKQLIGMILSSASFLPQHQEEKLQRIGNIRQMLHRQGYDEPDPDHSKSHQRLLKLLSTKKLTVEDIPIAFRKLLISPTGTHLVYVFSKLDLSDGLHAIALHDMVKHLRVNGTDYPPAGGPVIYALLITTVMQEGFFCLLVTLLLVWLLMYGWFRSLKITALALLPLAWGMLCVLLLMVVLDLRFSFINVAALPILIGVGVDDGIHFIHRHLEQPNTHIVSTWNALALPITLTTVTSLLGFLGMSLSIHYGLRGLGILALLGMTMILIASLFFLPICLHILYPTKTTPPIPGKTS